MILRFCRWIWGCRKVLQNFDRVSLFLELLMYWSFMRIYVLSYEFGFNKNFWAVTVLKLMRIFVAFSGFCRKKVWNRGSCVSSLSYFLWCFPLQTKRFLNFHLKIPTLYFLSFENSNNDFYFSGSLGLISQQFHSFTVTTTTRQVIIIATVNNNTFEK